MALSSIGRFRKKTLETAVDESSHSWAAFEFALGQKGVGGESGNPVLLSLASLVWQADSGFQLSSAFADPKMFDVTAPVTDAVQETVLNAPQATQSSNSVESLSTQQLPSAQAPAPADETVLFLTRRVDTINGAEGNNTFFGPAGTVQSKDSLIGGSGFNAAHLTLTAASASQIFAQYNLSLEKIEHVNFEIGQFANSLVPVELSALQWSGIEQVRFSQSSSKNSIISIEHLAINPVLAFSHFAGTIFAQYDHEVGTNDLSVILEDQSNVRLSVLPKHSFDRIDITSSGDGTNNLVIDIIGGDASYPREMFLFGNAPLHIQASDREFSSLTSIDARNLAGGLTLTIADPRPITVQGGIGNDHLILTGAVHGASSFDGGTGHDALSIDINSAPSFVSTTSIRSVEHLVAFDALHASATIRNSPDFDEIFLTSSIDQGASLRLIGFDKILLGADINGDLSVTSETPLTIELQESCDAISSLRFLSACDVTVNGNADFSITSLALDDAQISLRFSGSSYVRIQNANPAFPDVGDLIDLSNLTGGFDNNFSGAAFSGGSDFLIGDFHRQSSVRLDTTPHAKSEIVFGAELHARIIIYNMGLGDQIDLGQLGVSDFGDLEISFSSGISHIVSDAFAGAIDVVGIDLTSPAQASSYVDFNGHFG